jgi:hypothetical protein
MPHAKSAAAVGLVAALIGGCGSAVKPPQGRGKVDDPRTAAPANHLQCLVAHHLPAQKVGLAGVQIGALPGGPTIDFLPGPGAAQSAQIEGQPQYQGAEVIGTALLYPNQASDAELATIEDCLYPGVTQ